MSYYETAFKHPIAGRWHRNLVNLLRDLMPDGFEEMRHLDVGCGDGITIRSIKPHGLIVGVDPDSRMLEYAKSRGIETFCGSAEDLSQFGGGSFDLVTCLDVLEHLKHPTLALSEAYRVLRKRGFLVISTPNVTPLFKMVWWAWTTFGLGRYWADNSPHLLVYNLWNHSESGLSLVERLRDVGFKPERATTTNFGMLAGIRAVKL